MYRKCLYVLHRWSGPLSSSQCYDSSWTACVWLVYSSIFRFYRIYLLHSSIRMNIFLWVTNKDGNFIFMPTLSNKQVCDSFTTKNKIFNYLFVLVSDLFAHTSPVLQLSQIILEITLVCVFFTNRQTILINTMKIAHVLLNFVVFFKISEKVNNKLPTSKNLFFFPIDHIGTH